MQHADWMRNQIWEELIYQVRTSKIRVSGFVFNALKKKTLFLPCEMEQKNLRQQQACVRG